MRKTILTVALLATAGNLSLGVVYAAVCESNKGARACGTTCVAQADGGCNCTGNCSADEMNWVSSKRGDEEELLAQ